MNEWRRKRIAGGMAVILIILALGSAVYHAEPTRVLAAGTTAQETPEPGDGNGEDQGNLEVEIDRDDFTGVTLIFAPSTQPDLFVGCVTNPYFPLIPGTVFHYEETAEDEVVTVTTTVTGETKEIMGIQATVVHDVEEVDGEVTEDTFDWYAQDDRGNVWYLGEDTREIENGEVVSTEGSWEAGVDGAVPGIIVPGSPRPGDIYFQEFFEGEAEDMGGVISLTEQVEVPYGSFDNVLQTADFNPLDDELENKWYAPGVGLVRDEVVDNGSSAELISITHDSAEETGSDCGEVSVGE